MAMRKRPIATSPLYKAPVGSSLASGAGGRASAPSLGAIRAPSSSPRWQSGNSSDFTLDDDGHPKTEAQLVEERRLHAELEKRVQQIQHDHAEFRRLDENRLYIKEKMANVALRAQASLHEVQVLRGQLAPEDAQDAVLVATELPSPASPDVGNEVDERAIDASKLRLENNVLRSCVDDLKRELSAKDKVLSRLVERKEMVGSMRDSPSDGRLNSSPTSGVIGRPSPGIGRPSPGRSLNTVKESRLQGLPRAASSWEHQLAYEQDGRGEMPGRTGYRSARSPSASPTRGLSSSPSPRDKAQDVMSARLYSDRAKTLAKKPTPKAKPKPKPEWQHPTPEPKTKPKPKDPSSSPRPIRGGTAGTQSPSRSQSEEPTNEKPKERPGRAFWFRSPVPDAKEGSSKPTPSKMSSTGRTGGRLASWTQPSTNDYNEEVQQAREEVHQAEVEVLEAHEHLQASARQHSEQVEASSARSPQGYPTGFRPVTRLTSMPALPSSMSSTPPAMSTPSRGLIGQHEVPYLLLAEQEYADSALVRESSVEHQTPESGAGVDQRSDGLTEKRNLQTSWAEGLTDKRNLQTTASTPCLLGSTSSTKSSLKGLKRQESDLFQSQSKNSVHSTMVGGMGVVRQVSAGTVGDRQVMTATSARGPKPSPSPRQTTALWQTQPVALSTSDLLSQSQQQHAHQTKLQERSSPSQLSGKSSPKPNQTGPSRLGSRGAASPSSNPLRPVTRLTSMPDFGSSSSHVHVQTATSSRTAGAVPGSARTLASALASTSSVGTPASARTPAPGSARTPVPTPGSARTPVPSPSPALPPSRAVAPALTGAPPTLTGAPPTRQPQQRQQPQQQSFASQILDFAVQPQQQSFASPLLEFAQQPQQQTFGAQQPPTPSEKNRPRPSPTFSSVPPPTRESFAGGLQSQQSFAPPPPPPPLQSFVEPPPPEPPRPVHPAQSFPPPPPPPPPGASSATFAKQDELTSVTGSELPHWWWMN